MEETRNKLLWEVILVVLLLLVVLYFAPQILTLAENAQQRLSPTGQEKEEIVEGIHYRALGITQTDSPETILYKLFSNFDPLFLNEKENYKIIYNPFILDLGSRSYYAGDGILTNMTIEGVKIFNKTDPFYQVGKDNQQPMDCPVVDVNNLPLNLQLFFINLNYDNDCWLPILNNNLGIGNPCVIYVRGNYLNYNKFDGKVKIRVGWYNSSLSSTNGRGIIYVLIAMCDG